MSGDTIGNAFLFIGFTLVEVVEKVAFNLFNLGRKLNSRTKGRYFLSERCKPFLG
jgi:hypothetical protein